jgi:flagellar hook-associated protein 1 FlgK
MHDSFAESSLRSANSSLTSQQPTVKYADRVLNLIGSEAGSLTTALDKFFSSASRLGTDPSSDSLRQEFLSSANFLASRVRTVAADLQDVVVDNNSEVAQRVTELNGLSAQLSVINEELTKYGGKDQPPSLLDKRDVVLMKMSALAKIDVTFSDVGLAKVSLHSPNSSRVLVENSIVKELSVVGSNSPKNSQSITLGAISGGLIGGLVAVKSAVIVPLVSNLNTMINSFVSSANSHHKAGINAQGDVNVSLFSVGSDSNYAENMTLSIASSAQISAAGRLKISQPANNTAEIQATLSYGQNANWNGAIESEFTVAFTSATSYSVTQSGTTNAYNNFNINNGITLGDVKLMFDKAPAASDSFTVGSNASGLGDNSNVKAIAALHTEKIVSDKTLRNFYIDEVGKIATYSDLSSMSFEAKQAVYDHAFSAKDQKSGVNLDEEAAELIRLQQAFQGAAKLMQVSAEIFDAIIQASR